MTDATAPTSKLIEAYIAKFPSDVQTILREIRRVVQAAVPDAQEAFGYQMPGFKLQGKYLLYFGAWKEHIGFYALPSGTAAFKKELTPYVTSKGTAQFPLNKPMPYDLIQDMARFRAHEITQK